MEGFSPENLKEQSEVKKSWRKPIGKLLSISLLGLLGVGVIVFLALFVYFGWQLKYGDSEDKTKLAETFEARFTVDESLFNGVVGKDFIGDYKQYARQYNPIFGNDKGQIMILAFIDFECPFCKESYSSFKYVMEKYEPVDKKNGI